MKTEKQVRTYEFYPGDKLMIGCKCVNLEDHLAIVAELQAKIQRYESEPITIALMKSSERNILLHERIEKLRKALQRSIDFEYGWMPEARQALKEDEGEGCK